MERSTPVRKPHTSTADLLTWSENPPTDSPALGSAVRSHQPNGTPFQYLHGYRGRDRGRGMGSSCQGKKFFEDFDFIAMNEKFKKDEVWGHLGKSSKSHSMDKEGDEKFGDEDDTQEDDDQLPKFGVKTFGDFARYQGGRGGRGHGHGGYHGRGYSHVGW